MKFDLFCLGTSFVIFLWFLALSISKRISPIPAIPAGMLMIIFLYYYLFGGLSDNENINRSLEMPRLWKLCSIR